MHVRSLRAPTLALALVAPLSAAAAPGLTWLGPVVAGRDNVLQASGASPGGEVRVVIGRSAGTGPAVPGCPGLRVGILTPTVLPAGTADGGGVARWPWHAPASQEGATWRAQALDRSTCQLSPVLTWTFPTGTVVQLADADARMLGVANNDQAGFSVALPGDMDGDGTPDIVVGAYGAIDTGPETNAGAVYVLDGTAAGTLSLSTARGRLTGAASGDWAGESVAGAGDTDGDGLPDLLVGAQNHDVGGLNSGAAYLVRGAVVGDVSLATHIRLAGVAAGDRAGWSVASAGDVNDDGQPDVLVGAQNHAGLTADAGAAYLIHGPITASMSLSAATATFAGERSNDVAGGTVAAAGDVNGDGFGDILIGAQRHDPVSGVDAGMAYLLLGPSTGFSQLANADLRLRGEAAGDRAGVVATAGDMNGDGQDDIVVGAPMADANGVDSGAVYIFHTPIAGGDRSLATADAKLIGARKNDATGASLSGTGDIDGDGFDDLIIGASNAKPNGLGSGAVYLLYGPVWGTVELKAARGRFLGEIAFSRAGTAVAIGNVDNDGLDDILIGAPSTGAGGAYLLLASGL